MANAALQCPSCHTPCRPQARFCSGCGQPLASPAPSAHQHAPAREVAALVSSAGSVAPIPYGPVPVAIRYDTAPDSRNWAMAAHLSFLLVPLIGPLIVLLAKGGDYPFVGQHAKEAINAHLSLSIWGFIAGVVIGVTLGLGVIVVAPVAVLAGLAFLIFTLRGSMAASRGQAYRYPFIWRLVS